MNSQAGSRSGWSLHSITFSAADAAAAKESRQLTLSQMIWSMEHSKGKRMLQWAGSRAMWIDDAKIDNSQLACNSLGRIAILVAAPCLKKAHLMMLQQDAS